MTNYKKTTFAISHCALIFSMIATPAAFATSSSHSSSATPCPSAAAITAAGVKSVKYLYDDEWIMVSPAAKYGTNQDWYFAIETFEATNEADAKQQAQTVLNHLTNVNAHAKASNNYLCTYSSQDQDDMMIIAAMKPLDEIVFQF